MTKWDRKIHPGVFAAMYTGNVKMATIARHFGVTVQACRAARARLQLAPRPTGAPRNRKKATYTMEPKIALAPGDVVVVNLPAAAAFHGMPAFVDRVEPWGAHVFVPVFRFGRPPGRTPYRLLFSELTRVGHVPCQLPPEGEKPLPVTPGNPKTYPVSIDKMVDAVGKKLTVDKNRGEAGRNISPPISSHKPDPKLMGYTDDPCAACGAFKLRRNGVCTVCDSCGTTSGCS